MSDKKDWTGLQIAAAGVGAAALGYLAYKAVAGTQAEEEEVKGQFVDKNLNNLVELSREEAMKRSSVVGDVHYDLVLSFLNDPKEFEGYVRVTFELKEISEDAQPFLNFEGKSLEYCRVNGQDVPYDQEIFIDHKIHPPQNMLKVGQNVVDVRFTGLYRNDGIGIHRYEDPEDKEMYLYTLFESFSANKSFPCFDQPDIKATMTFNSIALDRWTVIANESLEKSTDEEEEYREIFDKIGCDHGITDRQPQGEFTVGSFPTTAKISSYLYAFVVGPYDFKENTLPEAKDHVPMRIFARKSMMKYVNHEEFFKITMAGMDYYKDFFGVAYPFRKYDQVYCPEFNCGAMENVGCVTYTENYLDRDEVVPWVKRNSRAITILHELSHQWFGNLVTMKWWDDLWLNEAFATFMSHLSLDNAEGLEEYQLSWNLFVRMNSWGLRTDGFSTTHPVAADVKDTEDAENIFDGISYGKGSSIMKQLNFYITEEKFREGIKNYFAKFPYQNTQLDDLIGTLDEACEGIDLVKWSDSWIKTSGFNIIAPVLEVSDEGDSKIVKFELHQSLSQHGENELRSQNIQVCFFDEDFNMEVIEEPVTVLAQQVTPLPQFVGRSAPTALYLNYKGWGYGDFLIDDRSLEAFKKGLSKIDDALTREFIYNTILKMVIEGRAPSHVFLDIIRTHISSETNLNILQILSSSLPSILKNYVPEDHYKTEADKTFDFLLNSYLPQAEGDEVIQNAISAIIHVAYNDTQKSILRDWLENKKPFTLKDGERQDIDAVITVSNKHTILKKIATSVELSGQGFKEFVESQLSEDTKNVDLVNRCRLSIEAAAYDKDVKNRFMDELLAAKCERSIWDQRAIAATLMPTCQSEIVLPLVDRFFNEIEVVFKNRLRDERDAIYFALDPTQFASEELLQKYKDLVEKLDPEEQKSLIAKLNESIESLTKMLAAKKLYAETI